MSLREEDIFPELRGRRSALREDAIFPELVAPLTGEQAAEMLHPLAGLTAPPRPDLVKPVIPSTFTPEGDLSLAGLPPPPATALARMGLRPQTLLEQAEQPAGFRPTPQVAEREARVAAEAEDLIRGAPVYGPEGRPTYVAPETLFFLEHGRRAAIRAIYGPNIAGTTGTALRYFTQVLGMGQTEAGQAIRETGKKIEAVAEEVGRQYASGYEGRHVIDQPSLVLDPGWLASGFVETGLSMAPGFVLGGAAVPTVRALGTTLRLSPDVVLRLSRLGGAFGFSATGGFQEGAGTYREVIARGGTEADAAKAATVFGLASMGLNAISAGSFFRALPAGARAKLVRFLTTGALEAATEAAEEPIEAFVLGDDAWKALKEAGLDVAVPAFLTGLVAPAVGGRLASRRGLSAPAMGAERIIAATERELAAAPAVPPSPAAAPPVGPIETAPLGDEAAALRDFIARAGERPGEPLAAPPAIVAPTVPAETLADSAARRRAEAATAIRGGILKPEAPAVPPQRPAGEEFRPAVAPKIAPVAPLPPPAPLARAVETPGRAEGLDPTDPAQLTRFVRAQGGLAPSPTGDLMGEYRAIPLYVKNRRGLSPDLMAQAVSEAAGRPVSDAELLGLLSRKGRLAAEAQARARAEAAAPERAIQVEQEARDLAALPEDEKIRRIIAMTGMSEAEARQTLMRPVVEPTEPVEAEPVRLGTDPVAALDRGFAAPPDSADHRIALELMDAVAEWIDAAGDLATARQRPEREVITPGRRGVAPLALTPAEQRAILAYAFPAEVGAEPGIVAPPEGPGARRPDVAPPAPPRPPAAAPAAEAPGGPAREPERTEAPAVAPEAPAFRRAEEPRRPYGRLLAQLEAGLAEPQDTEIRRTADDLLGFLRDYIGPEPIAEVRAAVMPHEVRFTARGQELRAPAIRALLAWAEANPELLRPAPRYERTALGDQALIPGAEARQIPTTPLRPEVSQRPVGETPLFRTEPEVEQPRLPGVEEERPAFRRPAPATFAFYQEVRGREPLAQFQLTADIPGHPEGSTVSPETLREAGYEVPETPSFEAWQRTRGVGEEGQALFQPTTYARRPDATPDTDRQGQLALFDLQEAARRPLSSETGSLAGREPGSRARTLGVGFTAEAINRELLETGTVNLRGQTVETAQDLAVLAQVLRDPRFETFRVFYVKDGTIIGQEALTSRMPGYAAAFLSEDFQGELREMGERMRALGAESYWLMHNHPSGDAKMSGADQNLTEMFARDVLGFRGHVVINSGEYGLLLPGAEPTKVPLPSAGRDLLLTPAVSHRMLGVVMTTAEEVARVGAALKAPKGWAVLLYRSGSRVRAIQDIPVADLMDWRRSEGWLRDKARAFGSQDVFLYSPEPDPALRAVAKRLIAQRVLMDYVAPTSQGFRGTATFEDIQRAGRVERLPPAVRVEAPESPYDRDREVIERVRAYGQRHPRTGGYEAWAEAMRRDLGPQVSPYLERAWREAEAPTRERLAPVPAGQAEPEAPKPPTPPGAPPAGPARPEFGPPALTEPTVRGDLHRRTVKAAGEAFERDGIARDERRWPVLSDQIVQMIREGQVRNETLEAVTRANGLTLVQFGEGLYRLSIGEAARRMQVLSALQRSLNRLAARADGDTARGLVSLAERVARLQEEETESEAADHALSWRRRADNVRRGLLVTQLATAVRNYEGQVGRIGLDVLDQALQRTFGGREADPWVPLRALADSLSQIRPTTGGAQARRASQAQIDALLEGFPRQWDRLFGTYASDIRRAAERSGRPLTGGDRVLGAAEQVVEVLNFFNRHQEYATRRAVFWAWMDARLTSRRLDTGIPGLPSDRLGALLRGEVRLDETQWDALEDDVRFSVDKALEMSFASQPAYGTLGWHFVKIVNRLPIVLTGPIPFPRFMVESLRFQYEFSPLPLLTGRIFTEAERAKFRAGDRQAVSRMVLGTTMLLAAWAVREGQDDDKRWYEVEAPGMGTVDIRPFNPFASYFFVGELIKRGRQGTLYKIESADLIRGIASANVRGGLGLFALDKLVQGLGELAKTGQWERALKSAGGEVVSGLLVPLRTLTDLYAQYDPELAVVRERREEPLLGPAKAQFGVGEPLYRPTRAAPEQREAPALRQATGLTIVSEKNALERELDRFQFQRQEIMPSTGIPEADNLLAKHMGRLAEERIVPQIGQRFYQDMRPGAQQDWLRQRLGTIRSLARNRARAEARELFGEVKQRREPARRRLMLEERRQELDRALAPVP